MQCVFVKHVTSETDCSFIFHNVKFLYKYFLKSHVCSDTPGKTGTPVIDDVDSDSVTLSWARPSDDGGDRVKGLCG